MDKTLLLKLRELSKEVHNEVFLFGKSLRNFIFLDKYTEKIDVFIKGELRNSELDALLQKYHVDFNFFYGGEIPNKNILFTLDDIYFKVEENTDSVIPKGPGFKDLTLGIISLAEGVEEKIKDNPEIILDAIYLLAETNFSLSVSLIKTIFFNRNYLLNIENKRKIYRFLVNIFVTSKKTRKVIATINTLGVSSALFGTKLYETAILNHLNKSDINEFFSIIFKNIEQSELQSFLIIKVGVLERDSHAIIELCNCIKQIKTEDDITARRILNVCGKDRIENLTRLLKSLGYKKLSKMIKTQGNAAVSYEDLALTTDTIKSSFKVEDMEANKLLDMALNKVITEPDYNEKDKLLIYLNKERRDSL